MTGYYIVGTIVALAGLFSVIAGAWLISKRRQFPRPRVALAIGISMCSILPLACLWAAALIAQGGP